jgi:sterol desaturase/sphingolipid hydroxylase (fatty acid hydroxylase superfamily)
VCPVQSLRHKNNYGDIVWWDMIFGTYENPKEWVHTCGFTQEREERLIEMLAYEDVHKKPPNRGTPGWGT